MFPKINLKYAKKKERKSKPLTPRTIRAIDTYVNTLHVKEINSNK
jgi:hypothetical protein